MDSGGINPLVLYSPLGGVIGQLHDPAILISGKYAQYSMDRGEGKIQSCNESTGEEKHVLPLSGIERQFFGHSARSRVTISTGKFLPIYAYIRVCVCVRARALLNTFGV